MSITATTLVQKFLIGDYPATKDELVARAQAQGADQQVLAAVTNLPDGRFGSASAVAHELGRSD